MTSGVIVKCKYLLSPLRRGIAIAGGSLFVAAIAAIRLVSLRADPPSWLSWSAGLYTDEGMYAGDARSEALFGHWTRGEFHGAMLSPVLYGVQLAMFRHFGAGLDRARLISALMGIATVVLLWVGMRVAFGNRAAWISAVLLGISTPFVLYNRLALMETPVACCLTAAFAFVALSAETECRAWVAAAALAFGLAVAIKSLAWLALPAFLIGIGARSKRHACVFVGTLTASFGLYAWLALAPWAHALARMNAYYIGHQYMPHSLLGLYGNIRRGIFTGERDGFLRTLAMLWPVGFMAAIYGLPLAFKRRSPADLLLAWWLIAPAAFWLMSSYTPSRYYVIVMPAIAAIAGLRLAQMGRKPLAAIIAAAIAADGFGLVQPLLRPIFAREAASRAIGRVIEPGSVIAGQFAPELAFGTMLESIYVQPGLVNDVNVVDRERVDYVLVTDSEYWNDWWDTACPGLRDNANRFGHVSAGGDYDVVIYQAPPSTKWYAMGGGDKPHGLKSAASIGALPLWGIHAGHNAPEGLSAKTSPVL